MLTKMIIVILVALVAVTSARPGYLHGHHHHLDYPYLHHHHEPLHVAKYVHVPAAISHQSSTIIHSAPIIKPVVVPVVKHVHVPIVKSYHAAPIINTIHPAPLHYDPFYHHHFDHHALHHFH